MCSERIQLPLHRERTYGKNRRTTVKNLSKLIDLYSPDSESPKLLALVRDETIDDSRKRPWARGYVLAQDVLEYLSLPGGADEWIDIRAIYERLGIHESLLPLNDSGIRAVSLAGPEHRPSALLNPKHGTYPGEFGRRFTLAHEALSYPFR